MCYHWLWGSHFVFRFVTPNHKSEFCSTPRTPTPFKSAMEKYGPLQPLVSIFTRAATRMATSTLISVVQFYCVSFKPQTPNLEDDINEVILRDTGVDMVLARSTPPEQRRKTMVTFFSLIFTCKNKNIYFHSSLCKCGSVFISFQHRPPMKKVRKSLALDVVDSSIVPKSKRKSTKHNIKVIIMMTLFWSCLLEFILIPLFDLSHRRNLL